MRRSWIVSGIAAIAATAGFVFLWQRPFSVELIRPEKDVQLRIYGLGTVEARVLSRIGFEVGAAMIALDADAGDLVAKGTVLARLHSGEQDARVARARAAISVSNSNMARAEAALGRGRAVLAEKESVNSRQQRLAKQDITSAQRAEEAQRDVDVARADLEVA